MSKTSLTIPSRGVPKKNTVSKRVIVLLLHPMRSPQPTSSDAGGHATPAHARACAGCGSDPDDGRACNAPAWHLFVVRNARENPPLGCNLAGAPLLSVCARARSAAGADDTRIGCAAPRRATACARLIGSLEQPRGAPPARLHQVRISQGAGRQIAHRVARRSLSRGHLATPDHPASRARSRPARRPRAVGGGLQ